MPEKYPNKRGKRDVYEPMPFVKATRDSQAERAKKKELRDWLAADSLRGLTDTGLLSAEEKQLIRDYVADGKKRQSKFCVSRRNTPHRQGVARTTTLRDAP